MSNVTTASQTSSREKRLLVVANRVPREGHDGGDSVLLELLRYLTSHGVQIRFACLSPICGPSPYTRIPSSLREVSGVVAPRNLSVLGWLMSTSPFVWLSHAEIVAGNWLPQPLARVLRRLRPCRRLARIVGVPQKKGFVDAPQSRDVSYVVEQCLRFRATSVMIDFAWLSPIFDAQRLPAQVQRVILSHDLVHLRVASFISAGVEPDLPEWSAEEEGALLKRGQVVILETAEEVSLAKQLAPNCKVLCVPRSYRACPRVGSEVRGRLLFVGGGARHNVTGLQWFLGHVWPRVRESVPFAELHVCGSVCSSVAVPHCEGVHLNGRVDDLSAHYHRSACVVIPLLAGTGFKTKLVEALAHGCACVSTSAGAWGATELRGRAIRIEDGPVEFAEAVCTVLRDDQLREAMGRAAMEFARRELDPEAVLSRVLIALR